MNVLYLNHSEQVSGAEQSLRALLWEFRREHSDIEPVVALPGGGPFADMLRAEEWNVTFAPMRRLHRPNSLLSGMTSLMHVLRTVPFITRLIHQTQSQLIHSNSTTAHLVGGVAAQRSEKPAIWHARDLVSLQGIAPALAQRAAWVVAISGCVAERLQNDGVPPEKVRIIQNGLNPDEWNPRATSQLRDSLALGEDNFLFGCVAQLVPWKNQNAFIDAAAQLCEDDGCSRARFAIIGGNLWGENRDYVAQLRERVKQHGLQDRFNFVPHQTDNVDALSALDCVVLPSHEEPFGRVLIEGMALRKPVIAYAENGPLEIIKQNHDGLLVSPDEENGLVNAMRRVLHDESLREHLAQHARDSVMQKFHIATTAKRVRDLYQEVLA